jgi:type II secretory pathway pseudopilin PulG
MIQNNNGFSRLEMLVAVIIIVIFIFISLLKSLSVLHKSEEIATKKGLASLKSAIAMYYGDNDGNYPDANIAKELVEKGYIKQIPYVYIPHHKKSNLILTSNLTENTDTGGWAYKVDNTTDSTGKAKGRIWINCSHSDWNKL